MLWVKSLVDPVKVAIRVIDGCYDGVTTSELDNLAAEVAATMTTTHLILRNWQREYQYRTSIKIRSHSLKLWMTSITTSIREPVRKGRFYPTKFIR